MSDKTPISQCCTGFALSMYTSPDTLMNKVRLAKKSAPQLLKRIGDHIAEVALGPTDGVCGQASSQGHFDFFERVTFNGVGATLAQWRIEL